MRKKLMSLALALVMCLSLCVPAFAAGSDSGTEVYTYDLGDGVIAVIRVHPAGEMIKPYKADIDFDGTADPSYTYRYTLNPADGDYFRAYVMSLEPLRSGNNMYVAFALTPVGGSTTYFPSRFVAPGGMTDIELIDPNGAGLNYVVKTTITAANTDSVDFNYWHNQYFR